MRVLREARALGVVQLGLSGGEPLLRHDLDELVAERARARPLLARSSPAAPSSDERARGAEGRRARPRAALVPEPDARRTTASRGDALVRAEDRGGAPRQGARLPADDELSSCTARTSIASSEILELARGAGRRTGGAREHAVLRLGGRATATALMPTREQLGAAEEAVERFRERVGPQGRVLCVLPDYYEDAAEAVHGRLGPHVDGGRRRTATCMPCHGRATIPGLEFANVRERRRSSGSGTSPTRSTRFRGHGVDAGAVPVVPARPAGGRLSAAAAARPCCSPAMRPPPTRSASSPSTTTASSPRATRRRPTSSSTAR